MERTEPDNSIEAGNRQLIAILEEHSKAEKERWKLEDARRISGIIFKIGSLFLIAGLVSVIGWINTYYPSLGIAQWVSDWYMSMATLLFAIGILFWGGAIVYAYTWKHWDKAIDRYD